MQTGKRIVYSVRSTQTTKIDKKFHFRDPDRVLSLSETQTNYRITTRATDDAEACGRVFVEIARRNGAPQDAEEMFIWADAVSPPPDTGHIGLGEEDVLVVYFLFLLTLILTVVPLLAIIKKLLTPLTREKVQKQKEFFARPSGEADYRTSTVTSS